MIYLYVPFTRLEGNKKLSKIATQWNKTVYEPRNVPCTVLSLDDVFAIPREGEKCKIYILAYEVDQRAEISPISHSIFGATIEIEELVTRLLASLLPSEGLVEIKLCIRQNVINNNSLIFPELIVEHFQKKNYLNHELSVGVQFSPNPFPGETGKLGYHSVTGNVAMLFNGGAETDKDNKTDEKDSNSDNYIITGQLR